MSKTVKGKFITVEGQDGAGKTTSLEFIHHELQRSGRDVLLTREPGGTALGERLRELILDGHDLNIDAMAELLLIFAARAQHLAETIVPALDSGQWVLCDRFTDATYAYQGGGRDLPGSYVQTLENLVQGELRPDLTLLLDVDLDTGARRAGQRCGDPDRFESEEIAFKRKVRQVYLDLARQHPDRIVVIDATAELEQVQQQIQHRLDIFMAQTP